MESPCSLVTLIFVGCNRFIYCLGATISIRLQPSGYYPEVFARRLLPDSAVSDETSAQ